MPIEPEALAASILLNAVRRLRPIADFDEFLGSLRNTIGRRGTIPLEVAEDFADLSSSHTV